MITFIDFDIYGRTDERGNPLILRGNEAIKNAIITYLLSKRGDYIRRPAFGGILDQIEFKVKNNDNLNAYSTELAQDITRHFGAYVNVLGVTINPDYAIRAIEVSLTIEYINTDAPEVETFYVYRKGLKYVDEINFIEVPFIGMALVNFILSEIPNQPSAPLVYNSAIKSFTWNNYKFPSLTTESDEYLYIVGILNT
jgi:hypothetical protein